jgi:uncharacterized membrane protein YhaH (DUF805 family)
VHIVNLLFSFHGRANRAQYWLGNLGAGFLGVLAIVFAAFLVAPHNGVKPDPFAQSVLTLGVFAPIMLAMAWAGLAIQAKRFHDRGRGAWFVLVPFIPGFVITLTVIGGVLTNAPGEQVVPQIVPWVGISGLINLAVFVDLGLMPGQDGPNKFGDPPGSGSPSTQFKPAGSAPAPSALNSASSALDAAIAQRKTPNLSALGMAPSVAVAIPAPAPVPQRVRSPARPAASPSFGRRTTS